MFRSAGAILYLLSAVSAFGQSDARPPSFEVAEVKVNKSGELRTDANFLPGGQIRVTNASMRLLITAAWHVRPDGLSGGPSWLDSDRFDVIGKATPNATEPELRRMLQTLLIERFKLAVHKEEKVASVYALTVGKNGPKLKDSAPAKPAEKVCGPGEGTPEQVHMLCHHTTMAQLAEALPGMAPRYITMPVVDQTSLKGSYEFQLDWTPMAPPTGRAGEGEPPSIETAGGFTIFDAVTKLGLKLERVKLPVPIIVIDHVDRVPVDN